MTSTPARPTAPPAFLALLLGAAAFVWLSSRGLPPLVASHFDAAGRVNGRMPRDRYVAIMLVITVLVPLLLVIVPNRALARPDARINLPNRDYWLAPQRREETIRVLSRQTAVFAALVILFLCYAQGLVVHANVLTPPALDPRAFLAGLAVFLILTLGWIVRLIRRFS
jgi:hypothetical protein